MGRSAARPGVLDLVGQLPGGEIGLAGLFLGLHLGQQVGTGVGPGPAGQGGTIVVKEHKPSLYFAVENAKNN